ncbi:hypothetical protein KTO58_19710 [Chitinophaga pendula]|uniref:hypothetical protein n=1 Tax=Chitinophaga TaxID=79328 RepID=UPI000BAFC65D|nr:MULTISPECIES: hypothetical protein [Chitinophaga]ASZ11105.1 hypothetical protein CK934_09090 [Chitinophaga sp. MD30]UCJ05897.1 hypothetical protein KTO58_19710 [Chitinophaga pendula]
MLSSNKKPDQVDWRKLMRLLTPIALRGKELFAFLYAGVSGIAAAHSRYLYFRKEVAYRLAITPQVCYLEKAINDRYDTVARRIKITDGVSYLPVPFFLKAEFKPRQFYTKAEAKQIVLYTKAETALFTVDFIVLVPIDVTFDLPEMTAFITAYKLAGKTFRIYKK